MSLDFLTDDLLIKNNNFDRPVIVTGAGGCIGAWILTILHRSNIPCVALDLSKYRIFQLYMNIKPQEMNLKHVLM